MTGFMVMQIHTPLCPFPNPKSWFINGRGCDEERASSKIATRVMPVLILLIFIHRVNGENRSLVVVPVGHCLLIHHFWQLI